ncbi:uncharacterized protein LOC106162216 isoform X2 [Lingula anatina]|nr:uncharacterized protein LOC106162216 isoform X2 [Lingula anatina]|eukprot:XP_013394855.1 uncharacterized protein LOC106162216 isoform X2 [Lingula anatina]
MENMNTRSSSTEQAKQKALKAAANMHAHISDIINSGQLGDELEDVHIAKVDIPIEFSAMKVHWVATGTERDNVIQEKLTQHNRHLRGLLAERNITHKVPPIYFIKDNLQHEKSSDNLFDIARKEVETYFQQENITEEEFLKRITPDAEKGVETVTTPGSLDNFKFDKNGIRRDDMIQKILACKTREDGKCAIEDEHPDVTRTIRMGNWREYVAQQKKFAEMFKEQDRKTHQMLKHEGSTLSLIEAAEGEIGIGASEEKITHTERNVRELRKTQDSRLERLAQRFTAKDLMDFTDSEYVGYESDSINGLQEANPFDERGLSEAGTDSSEDFAQNTTNSEHSQAEATTEHSRICAQHGHNSLYSLSETILELQAEGAIICEDPDETIPNVKWSKVIIQWVNDIPVFIVSMKAKGQIFKGIGGSSVDAKWNAIEKALVSLAPCKEELQYRIVSNYGLEKKPTYVAVLTINDMTFEGAGSTKLEAVQNSAQTAFMAVLHFPDICKPSTTRVQKKIKKPVSSPDKMAYVIERHIGKHQCQKVPSDHVSKLETTSETIESKHYQADPYVPRKKSTGAPSKKKYEKLPRKKKNENGKSREDKYKTKMTATAIEFLEDENYVLNCLTASYPKQRQQDEQTERCSSEKISMSSTHDNDYIVKNNAKGADVRYDISMIDTSKCEDFEKWEPSPSEGEHVDYDTYKMEGSVQEQLPSEKAPEPKTKKARKCGYCGGLDHINRISKHGIPECPQRRQAESVISSTERDGNSISSQNHDIEAL